MPNTKQQYIGTHSSKGTLLSWCAKYGLDKSTRRDLGYHIARHSRSVPTYSRDYQAAPMRRLEAVLSAIDSRAFDPDETRSGRFKRARAGDGVSKVGEKAAERKWVVARLYSKLHVRKEGTDKSCCGRADVTKPAFAVYVDVPRKAGMVKSLCGRCFPDDALDSFVARE